MSDFAVRVRAALTERGISLREAARAVPVDPGHLSRMLTGKRPVPEHVAQALDHLVGADGALAALAVTVNEEDRDRIAHSVATPSRLDAGTVRALADVLAAQRRLDDSLTATAMLGPTSAQWSTIQRLTRDARGPHTDALHEVAAEWVQFLGWLHAEARNDSDAVRWLTYAEDHADDIANGELAAQAANFKGYLARQQGRPRAVVRHFLTAYHTPGAAPLQRVGDAAQAAHGYALLGERDAARRLLGEASELADQAADTAPPETAYWLSPTFTRMGMGLVHLALGDRADAAENLRVGLDSLPAEQQDAEWTAEYRDALEIATS